MPIPKPGKGEKEEKFMGRCMGDDVMKKDYPKNVQRLAVCFGSWRKAHGGKPPKKESFIMSILRRFKRSKEETTETDRAKPQYQFASIVVYEAFLSLRKELDQAVREKFGKFSYVSDFSNKEVVIGFDRESKALGPSYQTDKYKKIKYKLTKGAIEFVGDPKTVERRTTYESRLEMADFVCLVDMEREIKKVLAEKKDGKV